MPPCQKSSAQVLQSASGKLGSRAANRSVNLELIWPPLYTEDATRLRGVGPVVARPATCCRAISAVVTRETPVITHPRPVVARSQPYAPNCDPSSPNPTPVVARFFLNFRTHCRMLPPVVVCSHPSSHAADPSSRTLDPLLRGVQLVIATFPMPARTCPRQPYKYTRVFSFRCTLSVHPNLHLPRRLLAGFSTGCFTFFIARHPP